MKTVHNIWVIVSLIGASTCFIPNGFIPNDFENEKSERNDMEDLGSWQVYQQQLDHFEPRSTPSFPQRFYSISKFYKKGGPLFIMLGGQTEIYDFFHQYYLPVFIARNQSAYFVSLEHRFYGQSIPGDNVTLENLQFLTVEQAAADTRDVIDYIRNDILDDEDARVILIGGAWGGTVAVRFQQLYPGVASGVWASSTAVLAKIDFPSFLESVGQSYRRVGGDGCYDRLDLGFKHIDALHANKSWSELERIFGFCNATAPENDIRVYFARIVSTLSYFAQGGYDRNIGDICTDLNKRPRETAFISIYEERRNTQCLPITRQNINNVFDYSNMKPWLYQQCSGMGGIGNTGSRNQPFGSMLTVDLFFDVCQHIFGETFTRESIIAREEAINKQFGGLNPPVENVVFANGEFDPRRVLYVKSSSQRNLFVVNVPGQAQLRDFFYIQNIDGPALIAAKREITRILLTFL